MKSLWRLAVAFVIFVNLTPLRAQVRPEWTAPQKPFRIAGNLYYVGSRDLAAYLVVTPAGNILINANLETSPPQIRASVETLGFRWADTKILLNSHGHFDHAGGSAEVIRETGAKFMVMDGDVSLIESGGKTDFDRLPQFPPAHVDRVLHDGDTVKLGGTVLTAHKTPGHTQGCTTWAMQVHDSKGDSNATYNVVIVGGMTVLDDYRLVATAGKPASYPGIAEDFAHGFAVLRALPCDIFLGAHGGYFDMREKLGKVPTEGVKAWVDPEGYQAAVQEAQEKFERRLAEQRTQAALAGGQH
jgi:metallo-beta-lactamase class B